MTVSGEDRSVDAMSAVNATLRFDRFDYAPMTPADLDDVVALERSVYPHPWSRGNFADSLDAGYHAWVLREGGQLAGYFLVMAAVDEAHLLNVSVAARCQRQGLGRYLLDKVAACARGLGAESVLLEVRPSNLRALDVYRRYGFVDIGRRKAYYPAHNGQREDAIVMRYVL
jgi:ribosomal-protein-alanine N-acetyltransferase